MLNNDCVTFRGKVEVKVLSREHSTAFPYEKKAEKQQKIIETDVDFMRRITPSLTLKLLK
jgi:hypothetical protein